MREKYKEAKRWASVTRAMQPTSVAHIGEHFAIRAKIKAAARKAAPKEAACGAEGAAQGLGVLQGA